MAEGQCNCGSIKVKIPKQPDQSVLCYCDNCRRSCGSAMSVNYVFERSDIDIDDPKDVLKGYADSNTKSGNTITRRFCGNCGSPVMTEVPTGTQVFLKGGLFFPLGKPIAEAFQENKSEWLSPLKMGGGK
ncbi:hypothetical protein P154DRAFT_527141 [Amniculicola lignicola CBS 123094]|uniref:CENP-V/GFA domain-containing protein n=1 Tax=Amniculicola lignicola CBS 123094 TaxID=1392246 RepID=A0A6A5VZA6_9PLEO|nr:hypothetical protein P154DRAFT_527141 [Amniculicola lignicola CBS 123094]